MTTVYTQHDAQLEPLRGHRIAVIGYGSQGRAHALNLRDSGLDVTVGLRPGGASWQAACDDGWSPLTVPDAVRGAALVSVLVPDMAQRSVLESQVFGELASGATLLFAHGFAVHYGLVHPPDGVDVALVAPKSPGDRVRAEYRRGRGVPCLLAIHHDATGGALERTLAYADGLGATRAGVLATTFAEETETDLFGEQTVLCGGVTELVTSGFEVLVEAGYQPEVAYFECLHELKLIVDLLHHGGLARMHRYVSETARYGDMTRGPRIIDGRVKQQMRDILGEIRSGAFAREWIDEDQAGRPLFQALTDQDLGHAVEEVGRTLRSRMDWLNDGAEAEP